MTTPYGVTRVDAVGLPASALAITPDPFFLVNPERWEFYDIADPRSRFRIGPSGAFTPFAGVRAFSQNAQQTAVGRLVGHTTPTPSSLVGTRCLKMEAEGAFDSVRLHLYHRETNSATVFKALVAATETAALTSAAVSGQPTVAGAQTAALRSALGAPGWASVTFGGASSGDLAAATAYAPTVLSSDWIELPSVARVAGETSTRPLLMVRVFHDGAANGAWNACGGFTADTDADKTAWENAGPRASGGNAHPSPWWREYQFNTITTTDGVTTPATNVPSATLQGAGMWVAVEFGYRNRAISVMGVGDSLTEGTISYGSFGSWGLRGCMLASSPSRPVSFFNAGISGQTSNTYVTAAETAVPIMKPTHVVYELMSPNDQAAVGALTAIEAGVHMARLQRMVRLCKANGARLVVVGPFPNNAYTVGSDAFRLQVRAAAAAAAAAGSAFDYLDVEAVLGDGATPARYKNGFAYDNTHPNNAAMDALATMLSTYLSGQ